jgi:hypothetical protein
VTSHVNGREDLGAFMRRESFKAYIYHLVGIEVLTAVAKKCSTFGDIASCSPVG